MTAGRWDAVVVGGGAAGCVVAARLGAGGREVLLIEAGPGEPRPSAAAGLDIIAAAELADRQWAGLEVRHQPEGQRHRYRQGYGLGGGTMINALLLSPGDRDDYRRWAQVHRCAGWGPQDMDPWLSAVADRYPGRPLPPRSLSQAFESAAAAAGHAVGGSSMDQDRLGVLATRLAVDGDRRRTAVDAYLGSSDGRPAAAGVSILTGRAVRRVIASDDRVTGVELADGETIDSPLVVLCAGAIATPALLLSSGIGGRSVGQRLKDHPSFAFTVALRSGDAEAPGGAQAQQRLVSRLLRWSSGPEERGDLQAFVIDRVDDGAAEDPALRRRHRTAGEGAAGPMGVVVVGLMRVSSTGSVSVDRQSVATTSGSTTSAVAASPALDVVTGVLGSVDDRRRLRSAVRHIGRLLRSRPMESLVGAIHIDDAGTPAAAIDTMTEVELDRWLVGHPGPYSHPAGSCAMGPSSDRRSVVACEPASAGRVLGCRGLYLADASILPDLVQGGLQVPVMAVAERVAAGILADAGRP